MGKTKTVSQDFLSILDNKTSVNATIKSTVEDKSISKDLSEKERNLILEAENIELNKKINELKDKVKQQQNDDNLNQQVEEFSNASDKYKKLKKEHEELKLKVKRDLRLIKERERELSNRIEILKQDNVALLQSKDSQILKLRKKLDDLQYELSLSQDKIQKSRQSKESYEEKLKQILRSLKISVSLIESVQKELDDE